MNECKKHFTRKSMSNFYENNHQNYFDTTSKIDSDTFLSSLAEYLHVGDSILDIGCGSGRDLLWGVQSVMSGMCKKGIIVKNQA